MKGLSLESLVEVFLKHIRDNYTKIDNKTYLCKTCNSKIQQVICYVSVHSKKFSDCVGMGKVNQMPLPYCPKCEGKPKNTSTCMHV